MAMEQKVANLCIVGDKLMMVSMGGGGERSRALKRAKEWKECKSIPHLSIQRSRFNHTF